MAVTGCSDTDQLGFFNESIYDYDYSGNFSSSLWNAMRSDMDISAETNRPEVQEQIRWLQNHQRYLARMIDNASPYLYYVYQQTRERRLPAALALLPVIESQYNLLAFNKSSGASGPWQMMPGTASGYGLKRDYWYDGRRDLVASTRAALNDLSRLHQMFDGNWLLALAAYDSGEGTVQAAMRHNANRRQPVDFWSLPLPQETRIYVPKLLALVAVIEDPKRYGISLPPIPNQPYFAQVNVGSQIDLKQAAKLADIRLSTLRRLNPEFNHWATDPHGPYTLLIPVSKVSAFKQNLAQLPKNNRVTWNYHKVVAGDSLDKIAHQYHVSAAALKQANHLSSDLLHIGQSLVIPEGGYAPGNTLMAQEASHVPTSVTYHVKAGDSLSTIAHRFHVSVGDLERHNQLKGHVLHIGQALTIPASAPRKAATALAQNTTKATKTERTVYEVKPGDSIDKIAHHYKIAAADIVHWNTLKDPKSLRPNQRLTLYLPQKG